MNSQDFTTGYRDNGKRIGIKKKHFNISLLLLLQIIAVPYALAVHSQTDHEAIAQSPVLNQDQIIIYVNPQTGDDAQLGRRLSPLKTITHALTVASAGSTIKLAQGTYSETTGEKFPLLLHKQISLQGNPDNQGYYTIIKGSGFFSSPTAAGQHVTMAATKDAGTVTGITITNDQARGYGLWVESASPQIISNTFTRNGNSGVSVNGESSPKIERNYFFNNSGNGLVVDSNATVEVRDNIFKQTGFGVSLLKQAVGIMEHNQFDSNRIAIILEGSSQAVLRHNEITNSSEAGLMAIAQSRVDLGIDNEPGNNIFQSNRKLDIHNATSNEIPAVQTEAQGRTIGKINFEQGTFITQNQAFPIREQNSSPKDWNNSLPPAPDLPEFASNTETSSDLPAPPPVLGTSSNRRELVFSAPSPAPKAPQVEPVPFLPHISSTAARDSQVKYKVLVETLNQKEENEVRSLYPEAFKTVFQGQPWLQVGAFNNWNKAKRAERTLADLGLETYLLE
ncbi:MAG: DUF1565 domain-containing protein [Cyanobacteria bacterium J06621_8]